MAIFLVEITFLMELTMFVAGLILFYKARKVSSSILGWTAAIFIVGSLATAACTTYYSLRYYKQGAFENAYIKGKITIRKRYKKRPYKRQQGKEL
jgi:hypothetical protein